MDKINVAELLKDCPKGMELDCAMYEGVYFDHVNDSRHHQIKCYVDKGNEHFEIAFTKYGQHISNNSAKCVIFPKGKTTWEGFHRPFKDGDIVSTMRGVWIGIVKKSVNNAYETYVTINSESLVYDNPIFCFEKFATEEEKAKLFKAIKDNGYRWNAETKTLENLIKPKFKVGDRIKHKNDKTVITITGIKDDYYFTQFYNTSKCDYQNEKISFKIQDKYELIPSKFDINTLIPFESKVLIRNDKDQYWIPAFWGCKRNDGYTTTFGWCKYCIPYKGNEHLLETNKDCDEYYKTWK